MRADLHTHTMLSDGTLGLEELMQVAKKSQVDTIAITDRDTLAGTVRAQIIGKRYNINVITGVELSCWDSDNNRKVHLLCYQPDSPDRLEGLCMRTSLARKKAGRLMIIKAVAKYPITAEFISKMAQGSTNVFKQHIMKALMHVGFADCVFGETYTELFKEKGEKNIAVPIKFPDVYEVLEEILGAGGIAVIAHPYHYDDEAFLDKLVEKGLCGVEAWHPTITEEQTEFLLKYAKKNKLLAVGGSDFKGYFARHNSKVGDVLTPEQNVNELLGYKAKIKRQKRKAEKAAAAKEQADV